MRQLLALAAVLSLVAACGRGLDEEAAGTTTSTSTSTTTSTLPAADDVPTESASLLVWTDVRYEEAATAAAAAFTSATGIEVTVEAKQIDEIEPQVRGGRGPDIFAGRHTWLGRLAPTGLAGTVALEARATEFEPIGLDAFDVAGSIRGVPYALNTVALFYNPTLVEGAPGAFSEIKTTCLGEEEEEPADEDEETTTTEADTTTTTEGEEEAEEEPSGPGCLVVRQQDPLTALSFLTAFGGYLYADTDEGGLDLGNVGLATDGALAGANFVADLVADGVVEAVPDIATMVARFVSGESVYLIGGLDLAAALRQAGAPFEVSPLPIMSGNAASPYVVAEGFMLAGRSGQQDTAALLLTDYLAAAGPMDAVAQAGAVPAYVAAQEAIAADQVLSAFLAAARQGRVLPEAPGMEAVLEALGTSLAGLYEQGAEMGDVLVLAAEQAAGLAR